MCVGQYARLRVCVLCVNYILHFGLRVVFIFFSVALHMITYLVPLGLDVPKNPVFMRVSGLGAFQETVFATLLQHFFQKRVFGQMK